MREIFEHRPLLSDNPIVTDGGSTKGDVVAAARSVRQADVASSCRRTRSPARNERPAAARWDLYQGKKVVVTPLPENSVMPLGASSAPGHCAVPIYELSPEAHDRVYAAVSHLQRLHHFALVHDLAMYAD